MIANTLHRTVVAVLAPPRLSRVPIDSRGALPPHQPRRAQAQAPGRYGSMRARRSITARATAGTERPNRGNTCPKPMRKRKATGPTTERGVPDLTQPLVEQLAAIVEADAAADGAQDDRSPQPNDLPDGPAEGADEESTQGGEDSAHYAS